MSSIRDALKRAERERRARADSDASAQTAATAPPEPIEPRDLDRSDADLKVIRPQPVPLIDVPVEFAEEMALFRHGVESAIPEPRRSLVISSATSGEGATTVSLLLATNLAVRDGKRTCLIDANFKSPRATSAFGLLARPGLGDYCMGSHELNEVLVRTDSPDLFVMGLGTDVFNPSLVLSHERARGLARELSHRFDYVLFDCGAVLTRPEAGILSATVSGTVLVVRAHRTKREVLAKAEKVIRFGGGKVIGSVLNRRHYPIPDAIYKRL